MKILKIPGLLPGHEKAVVGALIAILGAIVSAYGPDSGVGKICVIVLAGLISLGGVYGVKNTGYANTQEVVEAVKANVADDVAQVIDEAVKTTTTGVLKDVV